MKNIIDREKNIRLIQEKLLINEDWFIIFNYFAFNKNGFWYKTIFSKDGGIKVYDIDSNGGEYYNG